MPGGQSGNGWATCEQGHEHWGVFGAAGVLAYVAHPTDRALSQVLVQHRARWSHQGGTWAYHTVLAQAAEPVRVYSDADESDEVVWLPAGQVDQLDLHPGFAASWPALREALLPLTVFVDGTGSTGTPPGSGGAAEAGRRLHARLTGLARSGLAVLPDGVALPVLARWYPDYVLVLGHEAAAAAASSAAADKAREAGRAPRMPWDEPPTVRTAEIRIVAVTDGAQASKVITDLAASTTGHRIVVSDRRAAGDLEAAAGTVVTGLNWLLGPLQPG